MFFWKFLVEICEYTVNLIKLYMFVMSLGYSGQVRLV